MVVLVLQLLVVLEQPILEEEAVVVVTVETVQLEVLA
jgi:hypothetical protein